MGSKAYILLGGALIVFVTFAIVQSPTVRAVPSYARQTGLACTACHTVYPALTQFGRLFKLNGYTLTNLKQVAEVPTASGPGMSLNQALPISLILQATSTALAKRVAGNKNPDVNFPQEMGLYFAGEITPHIGSFLQVTYSQEDGHFGMDMTDIRYANQLQLARKALNWGITLNNGPTIEDLWNSSPMFGFPFVGSETAPMSAAGMPFLMGDQVAMNSVGVGPYAMYNEHLYGSVAVYHTVNQGNDPASGNDALQGAPVYWRLAWNQDAANYSWEIGTYGFDAKYQPGAGPLTDKYTDVGVDGQCQLFQGPHIFELRGNYIHESRTFDSTPVANRKNNLNFLNVNGDWYYERMFGISFGYFSSWGGSDCVLYNPGSGSCAVSDPMMGSRTGSPDTDGEIIQVDYLPWLNTKLTAQYTVYNQFNGSSSNYDGNGRSASDNNTLFLDLMIAF
jgi:hypothetical protein